MSRNKAFLVSHHGEPRLRFTGKDVDDMEDKLRSLGYSCTVLKDPTLSSWNSSFRHFVANLRGCEIGVFHFSGHGGVGQEGHHRLSLGRGISIDYEKEVMAYLTTQAPSMTHVHFLDCCRVGGDRIATGTPSRQSTSAGSRAKLEQCFALLDAGDGGDPYNNYAGGQQSKAVATQFVTVFGCDPGNTSVELRTLQNGVLTAGVLKLLGQPMLEMSEFVKRLGRFVSGAANQVPWVHANAQDDIYLNDGEHEDDDDDDDDDDDSDDDVDEDEEEDEGEQEEVHAGVSCDICRMLPIVGTRYKSRRLSDFDVCEECIMSAEAVDGRPYDVVETYYGASDGDDEEEEEGEVEQQVHEGVICDVCSMTPIVGTRYCSRRLRNYDVCERCITRPQAAAGSPYAAVEAAAVLVAAAPEPSSYTAILDAMHHFNIRSFPRR